MRGPVVPANSPLRNLEAVLKAACIAIGVITPKRARLAPYVRRKVAPITIRT